MLVTPFISIGQCPVGLYQIHYQAQIDNFPTSYPNCIDGDAFYIYGGNITDLSGLSQLNSLNTFGLLTNSQITSLANLGEILIKTSFVLDDNDALTTIEGVKFETSLQYIFINRNPNLVDISPMSVITDISNPWGGGLLRLNGPVGLNTLTGFSGLEYAKYIDIVAFDDLPSLEGLSNLQNVGRLLIAHNTNLISIDALSNLQSIEKLQISYNSSLSICNIQPVCDAIGGTQGPVFIDNNASGCATLQEVADACGVVLEVSEADLLTSDVSVFPNPVSEMLLIEVGDSIGFQRATIYSILGEEQLSFSELNIDFTSLSEGLYLLEIVTDKGSITKKIIKE